ncbi:MAG: UDP-2,4-diacetamido-2,4,6-trideoxy-beta-L-altropyranose hydrolase [Chloroflexota bacterium]
MAIDDAPSGTSRRAVVRADASAALGTGHVTRTRTLAEALVRRGWRVTFVTREMPARTAAAIEDAGIALLKLSADVESEPSEMAERIGDGIDLVVADHYGFDTRWFETIHRHLPGAMVVVIDDLGDRSMAVDVVLNQNLGADAAMYAGLIPAGARVLAGPAYALLRPEFAARRRRGRTRDGRVDRILIFLSGSDAPDVTARAMTALGDLGPSLDVVVGGAHPDLAGLRSIAARQPRTRLFVDTDAMAELMDGADLAVGAPGSASWERCALGLPAVLVILADNQVQTESHLVRAGAAVSVGWHTDVSAGTLARTVRELMSDPTRVMAMSAAAAAVTDGRGAERVVAEIESMRSQRRAEG